MIESIRDELPFIMQLTFNGVALAGIYILLALGITLVFGLTNIVLFAQGEMMLLGGYATFATVSATGNYGLGILVAVLLVAALAIALERGIFRHTLSVPMNGFIVSFGLIIMMQNLFVRIWSANPTRIDPLFDGTWDVGGVFIAPQRLFVLAVSFTAVVALLYLVRATRFGRALRACAQDVEVASLMGVPVGLIIMGTFAIGGAIAGISGALLISLFPITPYTGSFFIIKGFAIAIVGGLGSIEGALVVGLGLGLTESIASGYFPLEWRDAFAFGLIFLILMVRPQGFFRGSSGASS